mmetsp:Transcript_35119/g.87857  ORF Transcript_35119/g.87857 Transcript_35119/m.87857 type:complete len:249 (+) Transcript_35119:500-1246(+)
MDAFNESLQGGEVTLGPDVSQHCQPQLLVVEVLGEVVQEPRLDCLGGIVKERVPADGHHHAEHARLRPPQTRPAKVDPGRQGVRFDSQRGHVEVGGGNAQHFGAAPIAFHHRPPHAHGRIERQHRIVPHAGVGQPVPEGRQPVLCGAQVEETPQHFIGTLVQLPVLYRGHSDGEHPRRLCCLHSKRRVLHNQTCCRVRAQPLRREQEDVRRRLAVGHLVARAHHIELFQHALVRRHLDAQVLSWSARS